MDSLFGVPLTNILIVLLVLVAAIFGVLAWIGIRNPLLVKMGVRNLARRKTQTALIVIGLMLSTLIISAAFATGDTVGYSVTNAIYEQLGEADVVVVLDPDLAEPGEKMTDEHVRALQALAASDPDIDIVTGVVQTPIPAINPGARLSSPQALLVGVDPATVDGLNGLVAPDGERLAASMLGPNQAFVTEDLAEEVTLAAGGTVQVRYAGTAYDLQVVGIVRDNALSSPVGGTQQGGPPQQGGGVVISLETLRSIVTGSDGEPNLIIVSAVGGVRDTVDLSAQVADRLETAFEAQGLPLQVAVSKAELVGFAEFAGSLFVTFFLVFGLFSIAAGIMLIFLTFVMLAAERRSEMGMARAIGMKRMHLTQSFIAEGMAYNIGSAFVGAVLGLGVAWGLIAVLGSVADDFGLGITFHVNPVGFVIAYCLGLVITFITVAFSSWRSANLNIVRAIRDIPEPEPFKGKDRSLRALLLGVLGVVWLLLRITLAIISFGVIPLVRWLACRIAPVRQLWGRLNVAARTHRSNGSWAVVMLVIGLLATWWGGWVSQQAFAYTAGTTLVLFAIAMLAAYFGAPTRPVFATVSAITIWYWLLPMPFNLLFEGGKGWIDPLDGLFGLVGLGHEPIVWNIEMFFVSGVCITAASTLFVIFNADRLLGAVGLLRKVFGGITPAIRTAIAYPLAAKFRTGMTLAMFTLVMFSLVVMATLNHNFTQLFLGENARGGFDVRVVLNQNNPIEDLDAALTSGGFDVGSISAGGRMVTGQAEMKPTTEDDEYHFYRLSGLSPEFIAASDFKVSTSAAGYAGEGAALRALTSEPDVALINEQVFEFTQRSNFMNPDNFFSIEGAVGDLENGSWQPIPVTLRHPETGEEQTFRVVGVVESAVASGVVPPWVAVFVPESSALGVLDDPGQSYFLAVVGGTENAITVANGIESTLLDLGVQADSLQQIIDDSTAQQNAFSLLFVGFMSLGLVVGIAALGVIAFRTVAERRQQIGMLRAIGYSRRLVAISFFLESSFIAVTGIGMGLILGGALSYNLMTSPEFTNGQAIDFSFPVSTILIVVGVTYLATAVMTLIPARSASRVPVAEALRYSA
ncbi:MAG: FtsX-like permease family protein [Chloroflexi bacterium]|nr:FtsX-like permease family protein [Chloroflexota bacterium]